MDRAPLVAIVLGLMLAVVGSPAWPQGPAGLPEFLPPDLEKEIALSAAPKHLRSGVNVYLLGENGYRLERKGSNGFSCLVVRGSTLGPPRWRDAISGWCFDPHGMETIGRPMLDRAKYKQQGLSAEDIRNRINAGFAAGTYRSPERFGLIYMLSPINKVPDHRNGELYDYPPHVMYFAPYTSNDDIGVPGSVHTGDRQYVWSGLPFIPNAGPHGFVVQRLGEKESAAILEEHRDLLARVRQYVAIDPGNW